MKKAKNNSNENQSSINLHKCPFCSRVAMLLQASGIGNFKRGGSCYIAECQECGYRAITG